MVVAGILGTLELCLASPGQRGTFLGELGVWPDDGWFADDLRVERWSDGSDIKVCQPRYSECHCGSANAVTWIVFATP
ncbi:hypothetical protein EDD17DRAFT_1584574 [Pisolithus thermaeus]|nr:hypothetical protein EDD17DRAFT_1584574 [Pisolithus thermaeus]